MYCIVIASSLSLSLAMRPRPGLTILAHAILRMAPCGHMQRKLSGYQQMLRTRKLSKEMSTRSYQDAIDHLNSLQSNAETLNAIRASGGRSEFAIPEMLEYLERIGYIVSVCRCSATSDFIPSVPTTKRA
jgi:hypothetical protein